MNINSDVLKYDEKAIFKLRSLYSKHGYSRYKMNKFEEYELYSQNKDFLVSDNIITFTDTNGKLMALKPDVTLSIIKNSTGSKDSIQKVYYDENVYRISNGTKSYKEITQVGLECIGNIDKYCIFEVLSLAAESLKSISEDFILDISHLGIVSTVIDSLGISHEGRKKLLKCIGEKNVHGISEVCTAENTDGDKLEKIVSAYGSPKDVIPTLKNILGEETDELKELEEITSALENCGCKDKIRIDFSVINSMKYYNGFVFKGFINGISTGILSGGQYGRLMEKMGRKTEAIGFAVYLDMLERLEATEKHYDVDSVLLYDEFSDLNLISSTVKLLSDNDKSVMVLKSVPENLKYRQLLRLNEKGVEIIENNA